MLLFSNSEGRYCYNEKGENNIFFSEKKLIYVGNEFFLIKSQNNQQLTQRVSCNFISSLTLEIKAYITNKIPYFYLPASTVNCAQHRGFSSLTTPDINFLINFYTVQLESSK